MSSVFLSYFKEFLHKHFFVESHSKLNFNKLDNTINTVSDLDLVIKGGFDIINQDRSKGWQDRFINFLQDDYKIVICCEDKEQLGSLQFVLESWGFSSSLVVSEFLH